MTEATPLKPSTIRQYHALLRIAKDQAGKPEGETASKIAQQLLARHPELGRTRDPGVGSSRRGPGRGRPSAGWPSGGPTFRTLFQEVARAFGAPKLADVMDDIERDFPGLIDDIPRVVRDIRKGR